MQQLHDRNGQRKYLTPAERDAFLKAADAAEREVRTFCRVLIYTGCRISEGLALTADRVDIEDGVIIIESRKKRRSGVYRAVPAPPVFLDTLNVVHDLRAAHKRRDRGRRVHLWDWSRTTAWRRVDAVMEEADIVAFIPAQRDCIRASASRLSPATCRPERRPAKPRGAYDDLDLCRRRWPEANQLAERMW